MKKPTLEEVREHFKDAKVIRWPGYSGTMDIDTEKYGICYTDSNRIRQCVGKDEVYSPLLWTSIEGYAEIVEYKDDIVLNINKGIKIINEMEPKQDGTEFQLSFETVGGVDVILTGQSLDNLVTIANMIK